MNIKVGLLAAVGSFAGSALGSHVVLLLSDEALRAMMFVILPIAAVLILWRRKLPDENRDDGTMNAKKGRAGPRHRPWHRPVRRHLRPRHRDVCHHRLHHPDGL